MKGLYAFVRHNPGIVLSAFLLPLILIYAYSCQSMTVSLVQPNRKVTRIELVAEVDLILSRAEAKFQDLDRQDLVKQTIFNSVLDLAQGKTPNPIGIAITLAGILGAGAGVDNIRKRTHINTLKGEYRNVKKNQSKRKVTNPETPSTFIE